MKVTLKIEKEYDAVYLGAQCEVRYWEDAKVNGVEDENGDLIPCRSGDTWEPKIRLEDGKIMNWKDGVSAEIHYKVCDAGVYMLLDGAEDLIVEKDGYVPSMMCPEGGGYGDYIIMNVNADGMIDKWKADFDDFQEED